MSEPHTIPTDDKALLRQTVEAIISYVVDADELSDLVQRACAGETREQLQQHIVCQASVLAWLAGLSNQVNPEREFLLTLHTELKDQDIDPSQVDPSLGYDIYLKRQANHA